ncbi:oligosaccharide flippase family protein [Paenibacillus sp. J2TS4]|uniref:oligosaccharide flippase family protein n=1 Tax=Paenibacillus sp. J2TS4 TaxID=2807194 RepID=UPI001B0C6526|nr:oligosaccharide flippase family protein [Paenibacillus sp. J2TS4]GIP35030.1 polysaccharide biosynthesis protein [Paenibacillus sp. J2TS4]
MGKKISLKKNFQWMFIANLLYAFLQWLMLIIMAKFGSEELVGYYTLALAITTPIMLFFSFQLRGIQATDAKDDYQFRDYYSLRWIGVLLALLVCITVSYLSDYSAEARIIILLIAISKLIEGISDVIYGLLQRHEAMNKMAISIIARGGVSLLLFVIFYVVYHNFYFAITGFVLGWLLVLLFYDFRNAMHYIQKPLLTFDFRKLWKLFLLALPLGAIMMMGALSTNIPRYFIENYLSIEQLGIFGAITYILVGASRFTTAISQTVSPRLAKYYASGNKPAFIKLLAAVLFINGSLGIAGVVVAVFFGKPILTLVYTESYAEYSDLLIWVMLISLFSFLGSVLGVGATSMRIFSSQVPIHVTKLIVTVICSVWLIKDYGLNGAAWTLATASFVSVIFYSILIQKGLKNIRQVEVEV